jgi:hypothetical protein
MRSDLVDLLLFEHHRTAAAVLVSDDGEAKSAVWLPLSQVEITPTPSRSGGSEVTVTVPEWLATERGLV